MKSAGRKPRYRNVAILTAFDMGGKVVERHEMSLDEYYEELHELIDSNEYCATRGIVIIEGQLFDSSGRLSQEFRNRYSSTGAYEGGRTVHADGTVIED